MSRYEPRRVAAAAAACVSQSVLDRARMAMAARLDIADTLSIHDELLFDLGHHIFFVLVRVHVKYISSDYWSAMLSSDRVETLCKPRFVTNWSCKTLRRLRDERKSLDSLQS